MEEYFTKVVPEPDGKCVYCGEDVKPGTKWMCEECTKHHTPSDALRFKSKRIRAESGICTLCGVHPVDVRHRTCVVCRQKQKEFGMVLEERREKERQAKEEIVARAVEISEQNVKANPEEDMEHEYTEFECRQAFSIWNGNVFNGFDIINDPDGRGRKLMIMGEFYLKPVMGMDGMLGCQWINRFTNEIWGYRDMLLRVRGVYRR